MAICEEGSYGGYRSTYRDNSYYRRLERLRRMGQDERQRELSRMKRRSFVQFYGNLWEKYEKDAYGFRRMSWKKKLSKEMEVPRNYEYQDHQYREYAYKNNTIHTREDGTCAYCGNHKPVHTLRSVNNDESILVGICGECKDVVEDIDRYAIESIDYTGENNIYE